MTERMPILCGWEEYERLHSIAHTAAIQTGAKGEDLDEVIAGIVRVLVPQANRDVLKVRRAPPLRLIK